MTTPDHTFIELFAGIGGFRLALTAAGGSCLFASEWDRYAARTYEANFREYPEGDITKIDPLTIPDHDILTAGFPCQPFSLAGVSKNNSLGVSHGFDHPSQGTLFYEVIRVLRAKQPPAFILENVKNLLSHNGGMTFQVIRDSLTALGYTIFWEVIDSRSLVPQKRQRVYIVGLRDGGTFTFPSLKGEGPSLGDILEAGVDPKYTLSDRLWAGLQRHAQKHSSRGNGFGFGLTDLNGPSRTLSARYHKDGSEVLIPQPGSNPRRLTPREAARLMGFPDSFKIVCSDTQAYKQFGNSIAVPVVTEIARAVVLTLKGQGLLSLPTEEQG